jgi:hypothetical protein
MARDETLTDAALGALVGALPFPCISVPGEQALATWERMRAEGGGWPVILGSDQDLRKLALRDRLAAGRLAANLTEAAGLELPQALQAFCASRQAEDADDDEAMAPLERGEWPAEATPQGGPVMVRHGSGGFHPRVHLASLPVRDGAEALALLDWGGWNDVPPAPLLVAALRDWQARFGAELVAVNQDTLELRVSRPPATRDAAMALAEEQAAWCEDIVTQGTETVAALAAGLLDSPWWFFWWD